MQSDLASLPTDDLVALLRQQRLEEVPTAGESVQQFGANVLGGFANTFAAIPEYAGIIGAIDQEDAEGYAAAVRDFAKAIIPPVEGKKFGFVEDTLAQGIGSGISFLIPGAIGARATATAGAAARAFATMGVPAALGATVESTAQYYEALGHGADEDTAWSAFVLGHGVGATEALPIGAMLNSINKGTGGALQRILIEGAEELLQESGQTAAGNLIAQNLYDEDREVLEGIVEAGSAGFLTGVLLSAVTRKVPGLGPRPQEGEQGLADEPLPEGMESIGAQVDALNEGRIPAFLATPGSAKPEGLADDVLTEDTDRGALYYRDPATLEQAQAGQWGAALGYGIDEKPGEPGGVVVARDARGRIVRGVVVGAEADQAVLEAQERAAGEGGTVETLGAEEALEALRERAGERVPRQLQSALDEQTIRRAFGDTARAVESTEGSETGRTERFAKAHGRTVVFVENEDGSPLSREGFIDDETGVLYLDANTTDAQGVWAVALHELEHAFKGPRGETSSDWEAQAKALLAADPEGFQRFVDEYGARYEQEFGRPLPDDLQTDEGVAFLTQNLAPWLRFSFDNPGHLEKVLAGSDRGLVERLMDAVIRVLRGMGLDLQTSTQQRLARIREAVGETPSTAPLSTETLAEWTTTLRAGFDTMAGLEVQPPLLGRQGPVRPEGLPVTGAEPRPDTAPRSVSVTELDPAALAAAAEPVRRTPGEVARANQAKFLGEVGEGKYGLVPYVQSLGGLQWSPEAADMAERARGVKQGPGLSRLVQPEGSSKGVSLDALTEQLIEDGIWFPGSTTGDVRPADVLEAIEDNLRPASARDMDFDRFALAPETAGTKPSGEALAAVGPRQGAAISSRVPTAVKADEDALADHLVIGIEAVARDPKLLAKHAEWVKSLPHVRSGAGSDAAVIRRFTRMVADNLGWLYRQVPAETRARAQQWYVGARRVIDSWSAEYGLSEHQVAGVIAALSPQKDWFENLSLARRVIEGHRLAPSWEPAMGATADRIELDPRLRAAVEGQEFAGLNAHHQAVLLRLHDQTHTSPEFTGWSPEGDQLDVVRSQKGAPVRVSWQSYGAIAKAVRILSDGSMESISRELGEQHKVRSFYNNMLYPDGDWGDVTIDTHAVAAGLLMPLGASAPEVGAVLGGGPSSALLGVRGVYPIIADAYRIAAAREGTPPRAMQSITWEAVRGLFTPAQKRNKGLVSAVRQAWARYNEDRSTANGARERILEIAGGIEAPPWASGDRVDEGDGTRGEPRELPGDVVQPAAGVERADAGGAGRGAGAAAPRFALAPPTDSPEFARWFGDSKVVDAEGRPLVVYHGTNSGGFSTFDERMRGATGGEAWEGYFFSASADDAAGYQGTAGGSIMPAYLSLQNPLVVSFAADAVAEDAAFAEAIDRAYRDGRDGVVARFGESSSVYVAFQPTQIKSATGNRGTFDPADPDIRFALPFTSPFTPDSKPLKAAKASLRKNFLAQGDLPLAAFKEKINSDGVYNSEMSRLGTALADFDRAVQGQYGRRPGQRVIEQIDSALAGNNAALGGLNADLRAAIVELRDHVDTLSRRMIDSGALEGSIRARFVDPQGKAADAAVAAITAKVKGDLGVYLNRSYRVFRDPKWADKVPEDVKVRAKNLLRSEYKRRQGESATDYENRIQGKIDKLLMVGKAADSPIAVLAQSQLGSKDLSILTKRKDIAPEIRALWGEYKDARVNYANSVVKMSNIIANHQFLERVRAEGLGKFFFEEEVTNDDGAFVFPISGDQGAAMAPLNGLHTTKEIRDAFVEATSTESIPDWLRLYLRANSSVKYAKTVASLQTNVRNLLGNVGFAVANGHLRAGKMVPAAQAVWVDLRKQPKQKWRDYIRRAIEAGVLHESASAGELFDVIGETMGSDLDAMLDPSLGGTLKRALRKGAEVYQAQDDLWKLYAWENEIARWSKAEPTWTRLEVERHAAEIVRNTYPTYSLVPRAIRKLRRFPLVGSFVSFPWEVLRVTGNTMRQMSMELRSDNPEVRKIGAQRLAGMTVAALGTSAMAAASRALLGISGDDDDDARLFMAPWDRNGDLIWIGGDEDGNRTFVNLSYTDPYSYLKEPIMAFMRGESFDDALIDAMGQLLEPFFGEEILAQALIDVSRNRRETGQQIYTPEDPWNQIVADIASHVAQPFKPGTVASAERIGKGLIGKVEPYGRKYDPAVESLAVFTGHRLQTLDLSEALSFQGSDYSRSLSRVSSGLSSVAGSRGTVSDDELRQAYEQAENSRRELFEDMRRRIRAALALGVTEAEIRAALGGSMSKRAIVDLLRGQYRPYMPTGQFLASRSRGADAETAATYAQRRSFLRGLAAEVAQ